MRRSFAGKVLFVLLIAVLTVILFTADPFGLFRVRVQAEDAGTTYISYVVKEGDCLWNIADDHLCDEFPDHDSYIDEIRRTNHIENAYLYPGELILIPVNAASN